MAYDISRLEEPDQSIVSVRGRVERSAMPDFIGRSFGEIFGHLQGQGIDPSGEPFVIYHEFSPTDVDVEVCVPVTREVAPSGAITLRLLPGATMARTLHVGPYEDLADAYAALTHWIGQQGLEAVGPVRERYLDAPGDVPPTAYRTIIEMPIAAAPILVY